MENNKAIGVFDSGLGGLTSVGRLSQLLPGEDIIYLGDTGRVPYGGRSKETIIKYATQDVEFLLKQEIKAILVACATVSSNALEEISPKYEIPIYGVVEPTAKSAANATVNGKIGIIGTEASIRSRAYEKLILKEAPTVELFSKACPLLTPLVENGRFRPGDVVIETVVREYLEPIKNAGVDTLILGCTHYPLLGDVISEFMGDNVRLINSGAAGAEFVAEQLSGKGMLTSRKVEGKHQYFVSDSAESFSGLASIFLQRDATHEVKQIELGNV